MEFENSESDNSEFENSELENLKSENLECENLEFENLKFENSEFEKLGFWLLLGCDNSFNYMNAGSVVSKAFPFFGYRFLPCSLQFYIYIGFNISS